ncbi:hypothetical protein SSPO_048950 [Streptomyces antimycoticus]|uniref:Uncharacterized protein n=1 Tax=Streptomyces antimycoticus TaxID=68175 RepID=A0A499V7Q9_9ACTN|nr:hypothetical protein [Streptomyces antimycoticus]BBJ42177.1 hypothetical protein SSPO_048950 [Streptomyces antimycoticus]
METDTHISVIWSGIISDANYFGRYTRDILSSSDELLTSVLAFCMAPYFSLAMHESLQKIQKIDPGITAAFSKDTLDISTRSRHSLKLFEDTKRGIEGQIRYFREEIFPAHSARFLGNTCLPWARSLETDLGLYSYGGRLVTTTHTATYHLGFEPVKLLEKEAGPHIRSVFEEYGAFFGSLGANLEDEGADTFVTSLSASILHDEDVRSSKYYRQVFNGPETPEINAILTTFRALLNFTNLVLLDGLQRQHVEYTTLKIAYLSLYQVLRSVHILLKDPSYSLTASSAESAASIVGSDSAKEILNPNARPFRNMLMHYNLPPKTDASKVDFSRPFFGMIAEYFPDYEIGDFIELVRQCGYMTAGLLEQWAERC